VEFLLARGASDDSDAALGLTRWARDAGYLNPEGGYDAVLRMLA